MEAVVGDRIVVGRERLFLPPSGCARVAWQIGYGR
jgi:hypothetical protein